MRSSWRPRPLELGQASELIVVGLVELVELVEWGQVGLVEVLVGLSQMLWAWLEGWAGLGPDETVLELLEPFKKLFTHTFGISRSPATLRVLAPMLDLTLLMSTLLPPLEGNSA